MERVQYCALQFVPAATFSHSNLWSGLEVLGRFRRTKGIKPQFSNGTVSQFRLVRVHHKHREELGRLRLAGIGAVGVLICLRNVKG